jgi:hypothetical protein
MYCSTSAVIAVLHECSDHTQLLAQPQHLTVDVAATATTNTSRHYYYTVLSLLLQLTLLLHYNCYTTIYTTAVADTEVQMK